MNRRNTGKQRETALFTRRFSRTEAHASTSLTKLFTIMDIAIMNYATAEITTVTGCPDEWENEQIEEYLFKKLNLNESEIHYMCAKNLTNKTEKYRSLEVWPLLKQFQKLKVKHPDALLLFRSGDFYEAYMEDAVTAANLLGITLTRYSKQVDGEGKPMKQAGQRVAICDYTDILPKR